MPTLTNGLTRIIPSSTAVSGGSSSIATDGSVTFTNTSSISLNGVFTSTYDNYMITLVHSNSTSANIYSRLRVSGSDETSSVYARQYIDVNGATIFPQNSSGNNVWNALGYSGGSGGIGVNQAASTIYIFGPALAQFTQVRADMVFDASDISLTTACLAHGANTSCDGITFFPTGGTFTGTVTVFGLTQ